MGKFKKVKDRLLAVFFIAVVARAAKSLSEDNGTLAAAGISYYTFLSIFPLLIALVAVFGLFMSQEEVQEQLGQFLSQNLPASADVVQTSVSGVLQNRGATGIAGLVGLVWAGSAVFGAITKAINRAWAVSDEPPFYVSKPKQLLEALSVALVFGLSVGITAVVNTVTALPGPFSAESGTAGTIIAAVTSRFVTVLLALLIFLFVYKLVPNTETDWKGVLPGAILAAIVFEIGKNAFVWYVAEFGSFGETYGEFAGVVVLLIWLYYSALILIFGAEFITAWWAEKEDREHVSVPEPGSGEEQRAVPNV